MDLCEEAVTVRLSSNMLSLKRESVFRNNPMSDALDNIQKSFLKHLRKYLPKISYINHQA